MEAVPRWQTLRLYLSLFYLALSSSTSLFPSSSDPFAYPLLRDYLLSLSLLLARSLAYSVKQRKKPRGEIDRERERARPTQGPKMGQREGDDEHSHGILSDVDVHVNAEYLMGCQKQSL